MNFLSRASTGRLDLATCRVLPLAKWRWSGLAWSEACPLIHAVGQRQMRTCALSRDVPSNQRMTTVKMAHSLPPLLQRGPPSPAGTASIWDSPAATALSVLPFTFVVGAACPPG